jgi:hypothetical protein
MRNIKLAELNNVAGGTCPFLDAYHGEAIVVIVMPADHPDVSGMVLAMPASAPDNSVGSLMA